MNTEIKVGDKYVYRHDKTLIIEILAFTTVRVIYATENGSQDGTSMSNLFHNYKPYQKPPTPVKKIVAFEYQDGRVALTIEGSCTQMQLTEAGYRRIELTQEMFGWER